MNPSSEYGDGFDYDVIDMDAAQKNRFVWLDMESDYNDWIEWAIKEGLDNKVIEFISTFPEYLYKINEDDVRATPRSYERISKLYKQYKSNKDSIPKSIFYNVIKGNVGRVIAEEFISFSEKEYKPLISFEDVFSVEDLSDELIARIKSESHTRLYLSAMNILKELEETIEYNDNYVERLIKYLKNYPMDLMVGIMKDIKNNYPNIYSKAIENEEFIQCYFDSYRSIRSNILVNKNIDKCV